MAGTVCWTNAFVEVDGVDLSEHVEAVTLNYAAEMLDETAMGHGTRRNKGCLKTWSFDINFHQDFGSGAVDDTLFAKVGTSVDIEVRPDNSCSTGINPRYFGVASLETYNPVGGSVGTLLDAPATFQSKSTLTRSTAST